MAGPLQLCEWADPAHNQKRMKEIGCISREWKFELSSLLILAGSVFGWPVSVQIGEIASRGRTKQPVN
jgi:hypothetical protein